MVYDSTNAPYVGGVITHERIFLAPKIPTKRPLFVDNPPLSYAMTQRSSEGAYADDNAEYGREHNLVASNLSFPLDGVPSPYESAIRFRAANEAGSDKISLHSYHLMYGPFLAPYLETNVVSINRPCFT